jgi:menaquinone-dependent protoporphyrinogen oxidase
MKHVLVVYASRHGATRGIAERIAATLRDEGLICELADANDVPALDDVDAFVIGSAAYMGRWLKEATEFVRRHQDALATRPVWLFSSGPIGTDLVDRKGRSVLVEPEAVSAAARSLRARGTRVFFGKWDPTQPPLNVAERLFQMIPVPKDQMPMGDYRDWSAIEAWARDIARDLTGSTVALA